MDTMHYLDNIPILGEHEANTLEQARLCASMAHPLTPVGVAMAGEDEFDPYKD